MKRSWKQNMKTWAALALLVVPAMAYAADPVVLRYVDTQGSPATIADGVQTDPVSLALQPATGAALSFEASVNTADKYNVMIASGDIPDLFAFGPETRPKLGNLIQAGALLDLAALVDKYGPNIKKVAGSSLNFSKKELSGGTGKLYAIPARLVAGGPQNVYYQPYVGTHMRWDYFKEIGKPALKSFDDVAKAVIAIQKKHPTTPEGKKIYGVSMWSDWGLWHYTVLSEVMRGIQGKGGANFIDTKTYEYVDGLKDARSPLWIDSAFYNKLWRAGIVDPDSFTQTFDQAIAKFNAGQVTMQAAYWVLGGQNSTLVKTNADYLSIPVEGMSYNAAQYNPLGSKFYVVSANSKNPEKAIQVLNWMYSDEGARSLLDGAKGDTWTVDASGKAVLTAKGLTLKEDKDFVVNSGAQKYLNSTALDPQAKDSTGKQFIDLFNEPEVQAKTLTEAQKEWLANYKMDSTHNLWKKFNAFAPNSAYDQFAPVPSDESKRTSSKIDTYLSTAIPKLIMSKTDAEFTTNKATIIKDVNAIQEYAAMVAETKANIAKAKAAGAGY